MLRAAPVNGPLCMQYNLPLKPMMSQENCLEKGEEMNGKRSMWLGCSPVVKKSSPNSLSGAIHAFSSVSKDKILFIVHHHHNTAERQGILTLISSICLALFKLLRRTRGILVHERSCRLLIMDKWGFMIEGAAFSRYALSLSCLQHLFLGNMIFDEIAQPTQGA